MRFLRYALLPLTLAVVAQAQTVPFTLTSNLSGTSAAFQNGGTLTFSSPNGQTVSTQITATFTGTGDGDHRATTQRDGILRLYGDDQLRVAPDRERGQQLYYPGPVHAFRRCHQ